MNLTEILEMWKKDSSYDRSELGEEALRTISLHSKYLEIYKKEKLRLIKLLKETAPKLRLAKKEFYILGPHEETPDDWELPAQGRVLRQDVQEYMDADTDIIQLNLRIAVQQEIVDTLEQIVKEVQNRRWAIKSAIEFVKWTSGG